MKDPKALQLFKEVLTKTREGRIRWEPTASEIEFFSVLPSGHTIVTSRGSDNWGGGLTDDYSLVLRQGEQDLLRVTQDVDDVAQKDLQELFEFARRSALQVDATVD